MKNILIGFSLLWATAAMSQTPEADNKRISEGAQRAYGSNTTIVYKSVYKSDQNNSGQQPGSGYSSSGNTNAQSAGNVGNALGKLGASIDRRKNEKANTMQRGILFKDWKTAKKFGNWSWLEVAAGDEHTFRRIEKGNLLIEHISDNYTWTTLPLGNIGRSSYVYETVINMEKQNNQEGQLGILLEIDAIEGAESYDKLLFLLKPGDKMYWIGNFSRTDNNRWTTFNNDAIPEKGYWAIYDGIKGFNEEGISTNVLKIKKLGNDIMFFINGNAVLHYYIDEKPYFYNLAGIGIVDAGKFKGSVSSISFEAY